MGASGPGWGLMKYAQKVHYKAIAVIETIPYLAIYFRSVGCNFLHILSLFKFNGRVTFQMLPY